MIRKEFYLVQRGVEEEAIEALLPICGQKKVVGGQKSGEPNNFLLSTIQNCSCWADIYSFVKICAPNNLWGLIFSSIPIQQRQRLRPSIPFFFKGIPVIFLKTSFRAQYANIIQYLLDPTFLGE